MNSLLFTKPASNTIHYSSCRTATMYPQGREALYKSSKPVNFHYPTGPHSDDFSDTRAKNEHKATHPKNRTKAAFTFQPTDGRVKPAT